MNLLSLVRRKYKDQVSAILEDLLLEQFLKMPQCQLHRSISKYLVLADEDSTQRNYMTITVIAKNNFMILNMAYVETAFRPAALIFLNLSLQ